MFVLILLLIVISVAKLLLLNYYYLLMFFFLIDSNIEFVFSSLKVDFSHVTIIICSLGFCE